MKYKVQFLKQAEKELFNLPKIYQKALFSDIDIIKTEGIEFVNTRPVDELYEIKSGKVRALYKYAQGQIIIFGLVFLKTTQKTPKRYIDLAKKRLL